MLEYDSPRPTQLQYDLLYDSAERYHQHVVVVMEMPKYYTFGKRKNCQICERHMKILTNRDSVVHQHICILAGECNPSAEVSMSMG